MVVLGIVLILGGLGVLCTGSILFSVGLIAGGCICIACSSNKTTEKQETETKETWIAKQTKVYMDEGLSPSDAKVKAETEWKLKQVEEKKV